MLLAAPYSRGIAFHRQPLRKAYSIPSSTRRGSRGFLPAPGFLRCGGLTRPSAHGRDRGRDLFCPSGGLLHPSPVLTQEPTSPAPKRPRASAPQRAARRNCEKLFSSLWAICWKSCLGMILLYRFMDKKRFEGKSYLVYMTAGANKFLHIH